ncbi:GatB/YqeY domain-containing protein [Roseivirga sp. BDSF3-8]|uniref:GatB/YqeY domain-containing protein n=1 Tax=Roseivirga sp. BDSF3-8 TaxID=3241598 RepID=UPI003532725F
MSLKEQINNDIKHAMRNKNQDELRALRAIKSAILLAETEKGGGEGLKEETEFALLNKAAKQRRDSAAVFKEQNREDLAEKELAELEIIERYLPEQLSEDEVSAEVDKIISETGASGMKDMGKVMGAASQRMAGKADNKVIAAKVKERLSQ